MSVTSHEFTFYTASKSPAATWALFRGAYGGPYSAAASYDGTTTNLYDRDPDELLTLTAGAEILPSVLFQASKDSATNISMFALQNKNFSTWAVRINSSTSYTFSYSGFQYIAEFATIAASTIELMVYTLATGASVSLGQFILGEKVFTLPHNPNYADYKPKLSGMRENKVMADGGETTYQIKEKFAADIKLNFVPGSTTAELKALWSSATSFNFAPYPTNTAWEGEIYECNWIGDYDFLQNQRNARSTPYYTGTIRLRETPS